MDNMVEALQKNLVHILDGAEHIHVEMEQDKDVLILTFPGPGITGELRITGQTLERYMD